MAVRIVDELESIKIDEEHRKGLSAPVFLFVDEYLKPFSQQGPVGQTGQIVMARIIQQLFFCLFSGRDICQRTCYAVYLAFLVFYSEPPGMNPAVFPRFCADSMLTRKICELPCKVLLQFSGDPFHIICMYAR